MSIKLSRIRELIQSQTLNQNTGVADVVTKKDLAIIYRDIADIYNGGIVSEVFDAIANGSDQTTTTYLQTGLNVVSSASTANYCMRLPYPAVKGSVCKIVNNTSYPIVVYPSATGGSINGLAYGFAVIPADKNIYQFECWDASGSSMWSYQQKAGSTYTTGDITFTAPATGAMTCSDSTRYFTSDGFNSNSGVAYDSLNKPAFQTGTYTQAPNTYSYAFFKPSPAWLNPIELRCYTNILFSGCQIAILEGSYINYYNSSTGVFVGSESASASTPWGSYIDLDLKVSGSTAGQVATSIGDPGTYYKVQSLASLIPQIPTNGVGDYKFPGTFTTTSNGTPLNQTCDKYLSRYIQFGITTYTAQAGVKVRFELDYV